jgi:hypothetical protein
MEAIVAILFVLCGVIIDRLIIAVWNAYKKRPYSYTDCCEEEILKDWLESKN